jgi:hypothetical protein
MLAAKKKPEIDLAVVLGGGGKGGDKKPSPHMMPSDNDGDEMPAEGGEESGEDELPPGFAQAAEEAFDATRPTEERTAALYRAFKACGGY